MTVLAWVAGSEIAVIAVVGLLLFGGKLPDVLKDLGRVFFRLRRSVDDLRRETGIDDTLRELEREARSGGAEPPWRLPPPRYPATPAAASPPPAAPAPSEAPAAPPESGPRPDPVTPAPGAPEPRQP